MPSRNKINLEKVNASLFALCTECGYKIQSGEYRRVDSERLRCPKCGARSLIRTDAASLSLLCTECETRLSIGADGVVEYAQAVMADPQ